MPVKTIRDLRIAEHNNLNHLVGQLDAWLDTMRTAHGYAGPVVHWWRDCLRYTGAGLDWRYEGIIGGYLNLYQRSGDPRWLAKACRAGDDLIRGQLATGNFRNSSFERNPYSGGTPHEAACDLALLLLARELKDSNTRHTRAFKKDPKDTKESTDSSAVVELGLDGSESTRRGGDWQRYLQVAERNLNGFILGILWDENQAYFRNTAHDASFVPNKAATIVEALFAWAQLTGDDRLLEKYARPTLDRILACQVRAPGNWLDGAVLQGIAGAQINERYFPFYIARCIPALVQGSQMFAEPRYLEGARRALDFILRQRYADGSYPQVVYGNGKANRYPQWIAGIGDLLRAMDLLDIDSDSEGYSTTLNWMLSGTRGTPGMRPAHGFACQASQKSPAGFPEFRDLIGVCGWTDKAFRYLTRNVANAPLKGIDEIEPVEQPCLHRGEEAVYYEDDQVMELQHKGEILYRWRKGEPWAEVCLL
jgi:hypothetical protein